MHFPIISNNKVVLVLHKTLSSAVLFCPVKPLFSFLFFMIQIFHFFLFRVFFFSYHCVFYVLKLVEHNDDIRVVFVITDHQLLRAFLGGTVHLLCDWLLHLWSFLLNLCKVKSFSFGLSGIDWSNSWPKRIYRWKASLTMLELATALLTGRKSSRATRKLGNQSWNFIRVINPRKRCTGHLFHTNWWSEAQILYSFWSSVDRSADAKIHSADLSSSGSRGDVGKLGIHRKKFRAWRHFEPTLTSLCQFPDMGRCLRGNWRIARTMKGH